MLKLVQPRLFSFCFRITQSWQAAEDLVQDTLIKAFSQLDRVPNEPGVISWFFVVAKNTFIDQVRSSEGRIRSHSAPDLPEGVHSQDLETHLTIRAAMLKLSPQDRLLLNCVDFEGLSYAEAAAVLGVSVAAVTSRIHRVRSAFMGFFEEG